MASPKSVEVKRFFTVEEANRALPLVRQIVADIVRQWGVVSELEARLSALQRPERRKRPNDPYAEELEHSRAELEAQKEILQDYADELARLGVELKGPDVGLCDFPALRDGREVYLCWRLDEPEVRFWHELNDGFAGRQPLATLAAARPGGRSL